MKNIISLVMLMFVLAIAAYYATRNTDRDENEAAFALVEYLKGGDYAPSIAIYSYPSDCDVTKEHLGDIDTELFNNFVVANKYQNGPIYLSYLEGKINLLSWDDNLQVYDTERVSINFRPSDKDLILISRAGFNRDRTLAMFCLENEISGNIYFLQYKNGRWQYRGSFNVWVS